MRRRWRSCGVGQNREGPTCRYFMSYRCPFFDRRLSLGVRINPHARKIPRVSSGSIYQGFKPGTAYLTVDSEKCTVGSNLLKTQIITKNQRDEKYLQKHTTVGLLVFTHPLSNQLAYSLLLVSIWVPAAYMRNGDHQLSVT
jgi:hypothetical protein